MIQCYPEAVLSPHNVPLSRKFAPEEAVVLSQGLCQTSHPRPIERHDRVPVQLQDDPFLQLLGQGRQRHHDEGVDNFLLTDSDANCLFFVMLRFPLS